jgi:predicted phosphohydrolase
LLTSRFRLSEGLKDFKCMGNFPSVHWTIQSVEDSWSSSISVRPARGNVRHTSVLHVSQLRRCLKVLKEKRVPVETIDLQPDLRYQEVPVKILDTVVKRMRTSEVRVCRVQWSRHGVQEATWEREGALRKEFPHLFRN